MWSSRRNRTWLWANEMSIDADRDAFFRLQEQGYDLLPTFYTEDSKIIDFSSTEGIKMCTDYHYASVPADSLMCN